MSYLFLLNRNIQPCNCYKHRACYFHKGYRQFEKEGKIRIHIKLDSHMDGLYVDQEDHLNLKMVHILVNNYIDTVKSLDSTHLHSIF